MTFVPVPGIGMGSYAKDANLANWVDEQYLPGRKWNGAWDSEGLLSTLPAIGTCLLGVFAGLLLKEPSLLPHQKTLWLIGAGAAMVALCEGRSRAAPKGEPPQRFGDEDPTTPYKVYEGNDPHEKTTRTNCHQQAVAGRPCEHGGSSAFGRSI
jgi:hypothetical protein